MKRLLLVLMLVGVAPGAWAQDVPFYQVSNRQPVRLSINGIYQSYQFDNFKLSEFSVPVALTLPFGERAGLSVVASQASATGDNLESVNGLTDVQLGLAINQDVGEGSLVFNVGAGIPSGKRELTDEEFSTTILLSQQFYGFRVPGFGQGFSLSPGLVFAYPVGEDVVVGAGISYLFKGAYQPLASDDSDYDPGDELLLTGGFDVALGATTNLSLDLTYTLYGSDTFDEEEVFSSGERLAATAQLLTFFGFNQLRLVGRFRSQGEGSLEEGSNPSTTAQSLQTIPSHFLARASYRHRATPSIHLGFLAQGRFFDETMSEFTGDVDEALFESKTLFDIGFLPEFTVADGVVLMGRFIYTAGDFNGFEAGGGLSVQFNR